MLGCVYPRCRKKTASLLTCNSRGGSSSNKWLTTGAKVCGRAHCKIATFSWGNWVLRRSKLGRLRWLTSLDSPPPQTVSAEIIALPVTLNVLMPQCRTLACLAMGLCIDGSIAHVKYVAKTCFTFRSRRRRRGSSTRPERDDQVEHGSLH